MRVIIENANTSKRERNKKCRTAARTTRQDPGDRQGHPCHFVNPTSYLCILNLAFLVGKRRKFIFLISHQNLPNSALLFRFSEAISFLVTRSLELHRLRAPPPWELLPCPTVSDRGCYRKSVPGPTRQSPRGSQSLTPRPRPVVHPPL